jgi:hypothetical protein
MSTPVSGNHHRILTLSKFLGAAARARRRPGSRRIGTDAFDEGERERPSGVVAGGGRVLAMPEATIKAIFASTQAERDEQRNC